MRILHLVNHIRSVGNGIVNVAVDLACLQSELGHEVAVASAGGDYERLLTRANVRCFGLDQRSVRPLSLAMLPLRYRSIVHKFAPDIVHAHTIAGAVLAWLLRPYGGYGLITHAHNHFERKSRAMAVGDRIIAVSEAGARLLAACGVAAEKIRVVVNGTIGSPRTGARRSCRPISLPPNTILTVAGLYRRKGIAELIAAFDRVAARFPDAHLHLVGDGPDRAVFRELAARVDSSARIRFEGFRDDAECWMRAATVFVLASHRDPCPLVLCEAMQAGCAVVASHVDGIPEILDGGRAGILVPPGDVDALAAAMASLLNAPEERRRLQQAARQNAPRFDVRRVASQTIDIYKELLPSSNLAGNNNGTGAGHYQMILEPQSSPDGARKIACLQIGERWFAERAGGMPRYYADLAVHLAQAGIQARGLIVGSDRAALESQGLINSFADLPSPLWRRWIGVRNAVRRELAEHHVDLVVSHFALYTYPILRLLEHLPLVVHFHGPWAAEANRSVLRPLKAHVETVTYHRAARLITLSEAFKHILQSHYGIPPERIRVIPGGVDMRRFRSLPPRPAARACLGWPKGRPIVLAVRRLVWRMGIGDLISSVKQLRDAVPEVLVLIAGTGPLETELRAKVQAMGLSCHVRLLGYLKDEDLPMAYRAADLTIVPSVALEGFGLISVESLAAGTPPLVTPVGGMPEAVRELSPDLVLPDKGPQILADAMAQALRGDIRLPTAEACQQYVAVRFDWPVIAQRVARVYREAGA